MIILGTDTDVGKTTFALLWLHAFGHSFDYWKPVETGDSDSARVAELAPDVPIHPAVCRFLDPVAPPLAARRAGRAVPSARDLARSKPSPSQVGRSLLIETFGSPFSPLNDDELQLALLHALGGRCVLVSSTRLGCIGRTLQSLTALRGEGIDIAAVVLLGECDAYAEATIQQQHPGSVVVTLEPPVAWTVAAFRSAAAKQHAALDRVRTSLRTAHINCNELSANDQRTVWHPYTPLRGADEPLACVAAKDEFLELADGRKLIDGIASWWTILHGHRHPPLMQALAEAAGKLDHVLFAGVTHPAAVELADLLLGTMPWVGGRVFYSDNGSTAVEVALKMAYQYWCHQNEPQRTRFIGFEHGYHGDTFGAMAVSRDPVFFGRFEPLLCQADILPLDPDRLDAHLRQHANQVAGVIVEPLVQGAGGMRMHPPATLRQIAEITQRHGVLFLADEVMTGGGRTGTLWAHQAAGVVPDLLCASKTLTGGIMPLAATLVAPAVVARFLTADRSRTFFHGHSFTAHPLACAVAVRNYRLLQSEPLDAPARMERFWTRALLPLRENPRVKEVRIRGSIAAVELDVSGGYLADVGQRLRQTCLAHGVFLRPLGSVLYAMPPYCTSDESLARIAAAMMEAVKAI